MYASILKGKFTSCKNSFHFDNLALYKSQIVSVPSKILVLLYYLEGYLLCHLISVRGAGISSTD